MNETSPSQEQGTVDQQSAMHMSRFVLRAESYVDPYTQEPNRMAGVERLHFARSAWEDLRHDDPKYYVGLVAFGSSAKGRFHSESDLDMMLLVDPSRGDTTMSYHEMVQRADNAEIQLGSRYGKITHEKTGRQGSDHPIRLDGIAGVYTVIPINEQIIKQDIFDTVALRQEFEDEPYLVARKALIAPFLMRIVSGKIRDYRKMILDELSTQDDADAIWQAIAEKVLLYEEKNRGAEIHFPKTVEEAYAYFHIEHSKKTKE